MEPMPTPQAPQRSTRPRRPRTSVQAAYHHGDLRAALLVAAEAELAERGLETFSLRGVAKRAGVSHAAPAHHFADTDVLLTALAAIGFERFVSVQNLRRNKARKDPRSQLTAAGLGYVDFALAHPALFRLMFSSQRPDFAEPHLARAADAAFEALVNDVRRHRNVDPHTNAAAMRDVTTLWSLVHGLADLLNGGRLPKLKDLPVSKRDIAIADILMRSVPD
jgi:AcrR family transcriptional regulator